MLSKLASLSAVAVALSTLVDPAAAFWRLPCQGRLAVARMDPIVNPGDVSAHIHAIHGGDSMLYFLFILFYIHNWLTVIYRFQPRNLFPRPFEVQVYFVRHQTGFIRLLDSGLVLYAQERNRTAGGAGWRYSSVSSPLSWSSSSSIESSSDLLFSYYLQRGENVKAFPRGFRMLAGDTNLRNFSLPVPDPPKSTWSEDDSTQFALGQKALGFNCLNYQGAAEGFLARHTLPDKKFMDQHCTNGLRLEIAFPSCWNGKDLDSKDHRSHVAYPNLVEDGTCPEGFKTRLVTLFYETIWEVADFKDDDGYFALANGDPTGCGYHADFIEGWEDDVLQEAIDTCTNDSGLVEDCKVFELQNLDKQLKCTMELPDILANDRFELSGDGLPGDVKISKGPAYVVPDDKEPPSYDEPSEPQKPEKPSGPPPLAFPALSSSSASSKTSSKEPAYTPPPAETPYTTTTYTSGNAVYEVAIMKETVTATLDADTPGQTFADVVDSRKRHVGRRPHRHGH